MGGCGSKGPQEIPLVQRLNNYLGDGIVPICSLYICVLPLVTSALGD